MKLLASCALSAVLAAPAAVGFVYGGIVPTVPQFEAPRSYSQDKKLEVPDDAAQKEAEKTIRGIFKDDYAKRAPADRLALAKNLLRQGVETKDDNAARYVLLRDSQDLAARGGDLDTAFRAVDEMCRVYATNPLILKNGVLAAAAGMPRTPEEQKAVAQAYVTLADEACQARQFDLAAKASQSALAAAKKGKDVPLLTKAESQSKAMAAVQERYEKVKKSFETLTAAPESPDANQAVGEFECLALGDWEAGLPKIAKGSDPALKALAAKDLSKPSEGAELAALGDAWWDRAEKETGLSRSNLRQRAAFWYEQASAKLSGLSKVKVDKRVEEFGGSKSERGTPEPPAPKPSSNTIDILAQIDLKKDAIRGNWTRNAQGIVSPSNDIAYVQLPYVPGEEYDLTVVVKRGDGGNSFNIGVVVGSGANKHHGMVGFDCGPNGDLYGIGTSGGQGRLLGDVRHSYTIVCQVRKSSVAVLLDGKKVMDYQGDAGALSVGSQWVLPSREAPFIGSWTTSFTVSKITLTQVTGQTKKLALPEAKELALSGANLAFDKKLKLQTIDLLPKINLKTDVVNGDWKFVGPALRGQGAVNSAARVQVPVTPPAEYDLTLVLEKKEDSECMVGLIGGGKLFHMNFEGINGSSNGLGMIDGGMQKDFIPGKVFTKGTPRTVVCMVRNEGVVIQVDGKDYVAWKAQWEKVSVMPAWAVPHQDQLFLGVGSGTYHINKMTLTAPKDK